MTTMYRPPENTNRVKSIKSKFENIETKQNTTAWTANKRPTTLALSPNRNKLLLARQLSDPANNNNNNNKRNIKRTPAFRIDRNSAAGDKNAFQRDAACNQSSLNFEHKLKQFSSTGNDALKKKIEDCDNNRTDKIKQKPPLVKSKSSLDFAHIRSKFNNVAINNDQRNDDSYNSDSDVKGNNKRDLTLLYTEPIPKCLRVKTIECSNDDPIYSNLVGDVKNEDPNDFHNSDTLKISDRRTKVESDLTDTLKMALKKPLPKGPAPRKPPRTFATDNGKSKTKNPSFLHDLKHWPVAPKKDPRYMLNKLENALRNNKIKTSPTRKQKKATAAAAVVATTTTSGEDSDDSLLFRSKSTKSRSNLLFAGSTGTSNNNKSSSNNSTSSLNNLNCFQGLVSSCNSKDATYGTMGINVSLVSDGNRSEEPLYAEPFVFPIIIKAARSGTVGGRGGDRSAILNGSHRNSLYYMSTSVLCADGDKMPGSEDKDKDLCQDEIFLHEEPKSDAKRKTSTPKQVSMPHMSEENSSLSSFTSDLDSAMSTTPQDDGDASPLKIKHLINAFETRHNNTASLEEKNNTSHSHRVEDLKISLQKTLDRCFTTDNNDDEESTSRNVSVDAIVAKFQNYVKTMPKYRRLKRCRGGGPDDFLFYCLLIVGYDHETPQIRFKFPCNTEIPNKMEDLCYPEAASGPLDRSNSAQCYSLVITDDRGERTFGYCRRVIPEGCSHSIPLVYCILSKRRAPRFYKKILQELETRHGIPDKLRDELIGSFYCKKFPKPGESIKIDLTDIISDLNAFESSKNNINKIRHYVNGSSNNNNGDVDLTSFLQVGNSGEYGTLNKITKGVDKKSVCTNFCGTTEPNLIIENGGRTELVLTFHHDTRYEEADLKPLHKLPPDVLLKIFATLLLERKVVLISCMIGKLSCCVDALQSILYPFSWPHTFIPILPQCLWDVVESPTPVICGVLSPNIVNEHIIEDGIVVDLDEGDILSEQGDENSILSDSMKKAWTQTMVLANTVSPMDYVHSVYLGDAYIKVFITAIKHYKSHIVNGVFDKDGFIRGGKTKGIRRFLKWFTETTMFLSFIDSVITQPDSYSLFDKKIEIYGSNESNLILNKLLEWKK